MKRHSYAVAVGALVAGSVLFVYVVRRTGVHEIWLNVQTIGWGLGWLLLVSAVRPLARTLAWLHCLPPAERRVGWLRILRARLAADAMGNLTSAGPFVAEPSRVFFFGNRLSLPAASSSAALESLTYTLSCGVMLLTGALCWLLRFKLSESLQTVAVAISAAVALAVAALLLVFKERWAITETVSRVARRIVRRKGFDQAVDRHLYKLLEIEEYVYDFYRQRPGDFLRVMAYETIFHLAGAVEIYLTFLLLGVPTGWAAAFILEALNRLINMLFAFVPAKVGIDEAGSGWLAGLLGIGAAAGVTLALYRKLRLLLWTAAGLFCLALLARPQTSARPSAK